MKTAKKSFAYLVLIIGALIMVLPFFWMIISSLKTPSRRPRSCAISATPCS